MLWIIKCYLFRENLQIPVLDNGPLQKQEQSLAVKSESQKQESEFTPYSCIYSIGDHAQVGWYLKCYWLREQNVIPQQV